MKNNHLSWSKGLQQQTREAIGEMRINPDGKLHFKNHDGRGAFMTYQNLLGGKLSLSEKITGQVSEFADFDELLDAGWVVD